jgi:hypothetical protein
VPLLLVLRATSVAARAVSTPPEAVRNWFTGPGRVAAGIEQVGVSACPRRLPGE